MAYGVCIGKVQIFICFNIHILPLRRSAHPHFTRRRFAVVTDSVKGSDTSWPLCSWASSSPAGMEVLTGSTTLHKCSRTHHNCRSELPSNPHSNPVPKPNIIWDTSHGSIYAEWCKNRGDQNPGTFALWNICSQG